MSALILRDLVEDDEAAFLAGVKAWDGEDLQWHTFEWTPGTPFLQHLERLRNNARGVELKPAHVPSSMLYGFVDGVIVGRVSIRHRLNDYLLRRGGHVGYAVVPKCRRKGYATQMFAQALEVCRRLGLGRILLTCGVTNQASTRLILAHGGVLENEVYDAEDEEQIYRYWLDVPGPS